MIGILKQYMKQRRGRVAMLAAAAVVLAACELQVSEPPPPRPVFAMRIADTSGLAERAFPGRARAGQEVNRSFRVAGLGTFSLKKTKARKGRNPATGEQIKIKASKRMAFKMSAPVKDLLNPQKKK